MPEQEGGVGVPFEPERVEIDRRLIGAGVGDPSSEPDQRVAILRGAVVGHLRRGEVVGDGGGRCLRLEGREADEGNRYT